MKLQGKADFQANRKLVWEIMNETNALKKATPGCKSLEEVDDGFYKASLEMGVAAIKGHYDGEIVLSDKQEPERMTLKIKAEGSAGIIEAVANLNFIENSEGTVIEYEGEGSVSGLIAGVGQRMLTGVAKMILNQFFKAISKEVKIAQEKAS
ncbi:CoxG family protein [Robertmurraya massiliosenegalensis]|uniref:CoxG family protein n=1 Tax=Robertmurraya massiliosenegalensis TaxID=1287657 RepID=UPI0002E9DF89|nr:carbon monoxide dehydrogenase subunit G [Robertmurraya massiliosenegalensis]